MSKTYWWLLLSCCWFHTATYALMSTHNGANSTFTKQEIIRVTPTVFTKEPTNLFYIKQHLMLYHSSGAYEKEINKVIHEALNYLNIYLKRVPHSNKKPAIVLDIDETALSNYPHMIELGFGGTLAQIQQAENLGTDPVIAPTLKLYQYAKAHHIAVFFISGRPESEHAATIRNLKNAGYNNWDGLIFKPESYKKRPAAEYKTAMRKQLTKQGYNIILNIGDQKSDLVGGYANKGFKLPNPYYFIP